MRYDREGDSHFDIASALMKSLRGSDPDAAVHYLARLLEAGDMVTAIRRLLCSASEDVGLAYPQAVPIVKACVDSALQLGLPEARLPLAEAAILLATWPKSNSAYQAIAGAQADVRAGRAGDIPRELQNVHADSAGQEREQGYRYPHDYPGHWVRQQYLPDNLKNRTYYQYGDNKTEQAARRYWEEIKSRGAQRAPLGVSPRDERKENPWKPFASWWWRTIRTSTSCFVPLCATLSYQCQLNLLRQRGHALGRAGEL